MTFDITRARGPNYRARYAVSDIEIARRLYEWQQKPEPEPEPEPSLLQTVLGSALATVASRLPGGQALALLTPEGRDLAVADQVQNVLDTLKGGS